MTMECAMIRDKHSRSSTYDLFKNKHYVETNENTGRVRIFFKRFLWYLHNTTFLNVQFGNPHSEHVIFTITMPFVVLKKVFWPIAP